MTHEEIADNLLTPLWKGVSTDYKKRYVFNIWDQFQNAITSAAYTAKLSTFLAKIMQRLGIVIFADDAEKITAVIQCGEDKVILKMLRDETALLVLLVRVANEERKEKAKKRIERKDADENISLRGTDDRPLFD